MTREILYPEIESRKCVDEDALTAEVAKELLGWTTPKDSEVQKFESDDVHFRDLEENQVHCGNTTRFQRQWFFQSVKDLMWEILAGNWEFNGDSIRIGQTGYVLDGKHRLAALVLATQEWERNPERYPFWEEEPTLQTFVTLGLEERSEVVNTIGTGRPRKMADSMYASDLFNGAKKSQRAKLAKAAEHAVRLLWDRTGALVDAYSPRISHSEAFDFIQRHPSLISCVQTIVSEEENGKNRPLSRYLPLGQFSGLMYLMTTVDCSDEELANYRNSVQPGENLLPNMSVEEADKFIAALAKKDKFFQPLFQEFVKLDSMDNPNRICRLLLIIKAWNAFNESEKLTTKLLEIERESNEFGVDIIVDNPIVGGIDIGFPED